MSITTELERALAELGHAYEKAMVASAAIEPKRSPPGERTKRPRSPTTAPLPPKVLEAFKKLKYGQRGDPEDAMGAAQAAMGGGVLSFCLEHVGDLTHRMCEADPNGRLFNYGDVKDKVDKTLRRLEHPGFHEEFEDNLASNAKHRGIPLATFRTKAEETLKAYAAAHAKLTVYNRAQCLARTAAIALGRKQFLRAARLLRQLQGMLKDRTEWYSHASQCGTTPDGTPIPVKCMD